jgi:uncharacterized protein (DUF608 family)
MGTPTTCAAWCVLLVGAVCLGAEPAVERYAAAVAGEDGLVARWRFEGDAKDAKGAAHGEVRGGEAAWVEGPGGGKAIALEGGRFLAMGPAPALDLKETTVELWFRPLAAPGSTPYNPCLVAKRESSPKTRFSVHVWGDYAGLALWNGSQVLRFAPGGGPLRQGQWYHLAVAASEAGTVLYLDGVACKPLGPATAFHFGAAGLPLQIGASSPKGEEAFACAFDEAAVYARVLSAEDVARHADAMGWKARREELARAARERQEREKTEAAEGEARRARRKEELMKDDRLFALGPAREYRGENLGAIRMPVGGIASGSVQIDGRAMRPAWHVFGNFRDVTVPHSFFAVRVKAADGEPVLRALQTEPVGPMPAMKALAFRGEYPFGWYDFEDDAVPVRVGMETFSPLIPLNAKDSAIPCAVYTLTAENRGAKAVEVSFLAAQQNAVGWTGEGEMRDRAAPGYGGNANRVLREAGAAILHMTAEPARQGFGAGDLALAALAPQADGAAAWESLDALAEAFARSGALQGPREAGPSPQGETLDGALAVPLRLEPGQSRSVTFLLAWHFADAPSGGGAWGGKGRMYANWWPHALSVARDVAARLDALTAATRRFHETLYASNLPRWLLDRASSQVAILRSPTCFWTRDGYFGGWEGCGQGGGCCHGNCNHVWHYVQAHARLFPEIARTMREQEFRFQAADGGIPHRHPDAHPAFDGQCGAVLGAYREHLASPDRAWLDRNWPAAKKAMDYLVATWDKDEDGVLAGPQWNTLDGALGGSSSWLGTLYLAALAAAEKMVALEGDAAAAQRYARIRAAGAKTQNETLFNGEYYVQIPDPTPNEDYATGCAIDQVLGQWWAHQLDLGWLYPPERVRSALAALVKHNFRADFRGIPQSPRKFVDDDDAGLQMITWPKGPRPAKVIRYGDEVMTGFEYAAAAAMVQAGMLREGFGVVRAVADRYDGRLRTGLTPGDTASWGYSGNPFGDDECGKFYARAMSVWSMILACQGFVYDGPAGVLGFRPVWRPEDHRTFFSAAEGWGLFVQGRAERRQTERIEVRWGKVRVRTLLFEVPEGAQVAKASVSVGGKDVAAGVRQEGRRVTLALSEPLTVAADQAIDVALAW